MALQSKLVCDRLGCCSTSGCRSRSSGSAVRKGLERRTGRSGTRSYVDERKHSDPETDASFDPLRHDEGGAIELGIDQWVSGANGGWNEDEKNSCSIALDA